MSVPVGSDGDTDVGGTKWGFRKTPLTLGDSVHRVDCEEMDKSALSMSPQDLSSEAHDRTNDCTLSEVQMHYILQSIIAFEMHREWSGLACLGGLTKYGIPYESTIMVTPSPNTNGRASPGFNAAAIPEPHLLRLLFRQHILTFPGVDIAPQKYWTKRIQPWFDGIALLGLSTSIERGVPTKRQQLSFLLTRLVGTYFSRGISVVSPNSVSRLGQESAARPGDKELNTVDDVFPGVGPRGRYIGVVDAPNRKNMFVVASQKKGEQVLFVLRSQNAFETLDREVRTPTPISHVVVVLPV
jgi:PX-associated